MYGNAQNFPHEQQRWTHLQYACCVKTVTYVTGKKLQKCLDNCFCESFKSLTDSMVPLWFFNIHHRQISMVIAFTLILTNLHGMFSSYNNARNFWNNTKIHTAYFSERIGTFRILLAASLRPFTITFDCSQPNGWPSFLMLYKDINRIIQVHFVHILSVSVILK